MNRALRYLTYGFLLTIMIVFIFLLVLLLGYRISVGNTETFQGEVEYRMINIGHCGSGYYGFVREFAEELIGNRCLSVAGVGGFIVSGNDFKKVFPENLGAMEEKKYTMHVMLNSKPVLFGGYGRAEIIEVTKLDKEPKIKK